MHTVHVRVNDAATGKPTPCRVRFTDAEGRYYAPFGRLTDFAVVDAQEVGGNVMSDGKRYAYIDGACEIALPAGRILIEIDKGFEYIPIQEELHLAPGKLALRFTLRRWINMREKGWYSGDSGAYTLSPHAALLEGAAEDLAVVNLLAEEGFTSDEDRPFEHFVSNILAFSGQQPALQTPDCMVVVNTNNGHSGVLGSLSLLNCHRPVYPLSFGHTGYGQGADDWMLADWCDQCHRKGGLVVAQRFGGSVLSPQEQGHFPGGGETLADLIVGKIDAIDVDPALPSWLMADPLPEWRILLSAGFQIPLAGGSGKWNNAMRLGSYRTYARIEAGQEWTYKNWIEAVRAGRAFVTNGPLLFFTADGQEVGATLEPSSSSAAVHVHVEAKSWRPLQCVEVIFNGAVVAATEASGDWPSQAVLEVDVPFSGSGWLAARALCPRGPNELQRIYAHTSPVYVRVDGKPPRGDATEFAPFIAKLDAMSRWVAGEARCGEKHRQRLAGVFEAARQELLRRVQG